MSRDVAFEVAELRNVLAPHAAWAPRNLFGAQRLQRLDPASKPMPFRTRLAARWTKR